jgi:hypothetical protein
MQAYPFSVTSDSRQLGTVHLEHTWSHASSEARPAPPAARAALQAPSIVLS